MERKLYLQTDGKWNTKDIVIAFISKRQINWQELDNEEEVYKVLDMILNELSIQVNQVRYLQLPKDITLSDNDITCVKEVMKHFSHYVNIDDISHDEHGHIHSKTSKDYAIRSSTMMDLMKHDVYFSEEDFISLMEKRSKMIKHQFNDNGQYNIFGQSESGMIHLLDYPRDYSNMPDPDVVVISDEMAKSLNTDKLRENKK